jgi:hypothetical protein
MKLNVEFVTFWKQIVLIEVHESLINQVKNLWLIFESGKFTLHYSPSIVLVNFHEFLTERLNKASFDCIFG